ncbi:MAG: 50S ribosomal protein L4 [Patescibacteria group bacterium]|nr:50S ribosomal protein L4 [Patescibacteria group bacterium]
MSISVKTYNIKGEESGKIKLDEKVFAVKTNEALVHQVMVAQTANERQMIAHTKDRSEVRGGGRKPWRQKGTGRARAGSSRSPIWIGGGVTFGPRNERNFKKQINKKMKQKALLMVLSDKVESKQIFVLDELSYEKPNTKQAAEMFEKIVKKDNKENKISILVVNGKVDKKAWYSIRNLVGAKYINIDNINILDLLKKKNLFLTKEAVKILEEKYSK